jgi:hypothetical protein
MSDGKQDQRPEWELARERVRRVYENAWCQEGAKGGFLIAFIRNGQQYSLSSRYVDEPPAWIAADINVGAQGDAAPPQPEPPLLREAVEALRLAEIALVNCIPIGWKPDLPFAGFKRFNPLRDIRQILARYDTLSAPLSAAKGESHNALQD